MEKGSCWKKCFRKGFTAKQIAGFALSMNDWNSIHRVKASAMAKGYRGVIAQGLMIAGFAVPTILEKFPEVTFRELNLKFVGPLYVNSPVTVSCTLSGEKRGLARVNVTMTGESGKTLARGHCSFVLARKNT